MKKHSILLLSVFLLVIIFLSRCTKISENPSVRVISPASGMAGTTVTITGTNFSPVITGNTVMFNGTVASVVTATATSITTTVPTGATTGPVTVSNSGGKAMGPVFTVTPDIYTPYIYYRNNLGQDLLDPTTSGYIHQRDFDISWNININGNQGVMVYTDTVFNNKSYPSLPAGYCFAIPPSDSQSGLVKYIKFFKYPSPIDFPIDTLTFIYSGSILKKLYYNSTLINPPANLSSFPSQFPIIISK